MGKRANRRSGRKSNPVSNPLPPSQQAQKGTSNDFLYFILSSVVSMFPVLLQWSGVQALPFAISVPLYALFITFALWSFWKWELVRHWSKRERWLGVGSVTILLLAVSGYAVWGQYKKEHLSRATYPWVSANQILIDNDKKVTGVGLIASLRDYPPSRNEEKGLMTLSSLHHLHLVVTTPVRVGSAGGWHSCVVMDVNEPEWNNDNATGRISRLTLKRDVTVLEFQASTAEGSWKGSILLRKLGTVLESQESVIGSLLLPSRETEPISVNEIKTGVHVSKSTSFTITADLLRSYGVPEGIGTAANCAAEITVDELRIPY